MLMKLSQLGTSRASVNTKIKEPESDLENETQDSYLPLLPIGYNNFLQMNLC